MKRLIAALAAFVAVYLLTGFILWDMDPGAWSMDARVCVAFGGAGAAIWAAAYPGFGGEA
jgi:hypothetical protein